jgi:hypothetical protein
LIVQEASDTLSGKIQTAIDTCIPKARFTARGKDKPIWMDAKTLTKVKEKHHAWHRYKKSKDAKDYEQYVKIRNQAWWATRNAVRALEKCIAKEVKDNPKSFWKYAYTKTKTRTGISDLLTGNEDELTQNDDEKAEVLNRFFSEVCTKEDLSYIPELPRRNYGSSLSEVRITAEDVEKKLGKLKTGKSPGPDGIHPRVLQELSTILHVPLHIIFTRSLEEGALPGIWKQGNVSPIFKKGNRHMPSNYRPVSLTAVACKVMESFVREAILEHMNANGLLAEEQHGFIAGRSCITQLLECLEEWTRIMDEGGHVDVIYMDFMKAFDSVPHRRLLSKLKSYGIEGPIYNWIESFLTQRQQRVMVNGAASSWSEVTSGIPQGSVLGPVLFVVYINGLPDVVSCGVKLFADDTKIYRAIRNRDDSRTTKEPGCPASMGRNTATPISPRKMQSTTSGARSGRVHLPHAKSHPRWSAKSRGKSSGKRSGSACGQKAELFKAHTTSCVQIQQAAGCDQTIIPVSG